MELILTYFPQLQDRQIAQLEALGSLYRAWNEKVNVISRKDIDNLYERHILHALSIGLFFRFEQGTRLLDVGTGGGFPGIPLAILFPDAHFHLIDSIGKKIMVVQDIAAQIGLHNTTASQTNVKQCKEQYHVVLSRALTSFPEFHQLVKHTLLKKQRNPSTPNGIIYLKGGGVEDEIKTFPHLQVFHLGTKIQQEFFTSKKILYLPPDIKTMRTARKHHSQKTQ